MRRRSSRVRSSRSGRPCSSVRSTNFQHKHIHFICFSFGFCFQFFSIFFGRILCAPPRSQSVNALAWTLVSHSDLASIIITTTFKYSVIKVQGQNWVARYDVPTSFHTTKKEGFTLSHLRTVSSRHSSGCSSRCGSIVIVITKPLSRFMYHSYQSTLDCCNADCTCWLPAASICSEICSAGYCILSHLMFVYGDMMFTCTDQTTSSPLQMLNFFFFFF